MITKQFKDWIMEAISRKSVVSIARKAADEATTSHSEAYQAWKNHQGKFPETGVGQKIVQIDGKSYLVTYDSERWQFNDVVELPFEVWKEMKKPV